MKTNRPENSRYRFSLLLLLQLNIMLAIDQQIWLRLPKDVDHLRGVFGGIQTDVEDELGAEHRR